LVSGEESSSHAAYAESGWFIYSISPFRMLWAVIQYRDKIRAWVDVGYSTLEDN
jgi:hypothetical protein